VRVGAAIPPSGLFAALLLLSWPLYSLLSTSYLSNQHDVPCTSM
jgi:hypothetical protein